MKTQNTLLLTIVMIAILIISGCATPNDSKNKESIKIGGILSLTGAAASWGQAAKNGANMAVEDINLKGGILGKNIEIVYEDDQSNTVQTVNSFQKLTEIDNIKIIIGPSWTKFGLAIKDLVDDEVVISPSLGGADFNKDNKYIFNTRQHDYILSRSLAEYVYGKGYRTVAILSVNDPYNIEQADEFKKSFENLGGNVKFVFEPVIEQKDVRSDLLKVKNDKDIDVLIATTGATPLTSIFAIQIKELDIKLPVYSVTIDQSRIDESKGAIDGWEYLSSFTPTTDFSERYSQNFNKSVQISSDSAYDAVMMISEAMEKTESTDPELIQKYLSEIKSYSGVSGELVADGEGGFTKNYVVFQVKEGVPQKIVS